VKTWVYVDGFNLYFGAVKGTLYKWLDIHTLCSLLLPGRTIERIKYFTAKVQARPHDPNPPIRQQIYLRALATLGNVEVFFGHFLTHRVSMPLANPVVGQSPYAWVLRTDEKGSDVNLASHLLHDGHLGRYEMAVVLSGDSDLLCPVRLVMQDLRKPVGVLNPQQRTCRVLAQEATFYKQIRTGVVASSQFPPDLVDAQGAFHKPAGWYRAWRRPYPS